MQRAMNKTNILKRYITKPVFVVLVLSLVFVVFNLYLAQRGRPYTSDDVSWQNILTTWVPFNGHKVDMGIKDNFIVNVPFLMILGRVFGASRTTLLIEASVFAAINFVLFYYAGLYFLKKCQVKITYETLLPFLWLASLGYNFSQLFLNAAWRDFEMGVSFVLFVLAIKLYYGEIKPLATWPARLLTALTVFITGVFIYSDPYFFYLTVGPIVLLYTTLFIAKKATKTQLIEVLGGTVVSLVVARALKSVAARTGLFIPHGHLASLIPLNHLVPEFISTLDEMTTIFGVNISGVSFFSMSGVASVLNLVIILSVLAWFAVFITRHFKRNPHSEGDRISPFILISSFLGALYGIVFLACLSNGEDDYRYFVLSVYALAILAAFVVGTLKKGAQVFMLLIYVTIFINLATSLFALTPMQKSNANGDKANAANYAVIQKVKQLGLTKGYGNYWDGNINTYFAAGSAEFLPVECIDNGTTEPLYLLVDTNEFALPAKRSFYVADDIQSSPPSCTEKQVLAQFGKPQQIVRIAGKDILVYNYDLVTKMPQV